MSEKICGLIIFNKYMKSCLVMHFDTYCTELDAYKALSVKYSHPLKNYHHLVGSGSVNFGSLLYLVPESGFNPKLDAPESPQFHNGAS